MCHCVKLSCIGLYGVERGREVGMEEGEEMLCGNKHDVCRKVVRLGSTAPPLGSRGIQPSKVCDSRTSDHGGMLQSHIGRSRACDSLASDNLRGMPLSHNSLHTLFIQHGVFQMPIINCPEI